MASDATFVVVGASLAGGTAAATLRDVGFDGRLVLVGEEPLQPYERPPLSKEYLRGEQSLEEGFVHPAEKYEELGIEARFGERVHRVDPRDRCVQMRSGEEIPFEKVLVATGVRNRHLDVPGIELPGVYDLRSAADCDRIREASEIAQHVLIVGMGFVGAEVAASMRKLGKRVTVVEVFETALYRVLGGDIGRVLEAEHRDQGVEMFFGDTVERFEGDGRAERAVTRAGRTVEFDMAVVGVGTEPVAEVMHGVGLASNGGVKVGPTLESPEIPGLFSAGDVATHDHPVFGPMRVEHFDNAIKMGEAAAKNMLGAAEAFDDPHWFWSDQYDMNLQMAGFAPSWKDMVVRGSPEDRKFCAFLLDEGGVLRSTVSVNWPRDVRRSFKLISAQVAPDPTLLADPEVDLRKLVGA